jgi:hypothetical protein
MARSQKPSILELFNWHGCSKVGTCKLPHLQHDLADSGIEVRRWLISKARIKWE